MPTSHNARTHQIRYIFCFLIQIMMTEHQDLYTKGKLCTSIAFFLSILSSFSPFCFCRFVDDIRFDSIVGSLVDRVEMEMRRRGWWGLTPVARLANLVYRIATERPQTEENNTEKSISACVRRRREVKQGTPAHDDIYSVRRNRSESHFALDTGWVISCFYFLCLRPGDDDGDMGRKRETN